MGLRELLRGNHKRGELLLSTVSGVLTTNSEMIEYVDKNLDEIRVITTKSYQVKPNDGNREPIVCEPGVGDFGNSVGLRNPGMEKGFEDLKALRDRGLRSYLNVSISASTIEDFITLAKKFAPVADMIELNYSCPHAKKGYGASIGSDEKAVYDFTKAIKEAVSEYSDLLLIPKLTPNVDDIAKMAEIAKEAGADGVAAINTVGPNLYLEKDSGEPILNNPPTFKGGASGEWVKERALESIKAIRERVGEEFIILGMGGVTDEKDARALLLSGADIVGIGSAFARLEMKDYKNYLKAIVSFHDASKYLSKKNQMVYRSLKVKKRAVSGDLIMLEFDTSEKISAGQFVFLWIPGLGEKPFSPFTTSPFRLLIKKRGLFTSGVFNIKEGDRVYIRGPYGKPFDIDRSAHSVIIAGGSGLALIPMISKELVGDRDIYIGLVDDYVTGSEIQSVLNESGKVHIVKDDGKPARVIYELEAPRDKDSKAYVIGPEVMMFKAAERLIELGYKRECIFLSMEKSTRCGVGLCGECATYGRLTCKEGTFFSYEALS